MVAPGKSIGSRLWGLGVVATMAVGLCLLAPETPLASKASAQAAKPRVTCVKMKPGAFRYRRRPARCNYHYENAFPFPVFSWNLIQTRRMKWRHWGARSARGRGFFFSRKPPWWKQVRVRLSRPRTVCGSRAFTRFRLKVKRPRGWPKRWGRRIAIRSCKPSHRL